MLRIVDSPPSEAISSSRDSPISPTLRFSILHAQQPPIIVEERDGPQPSILITDVVVPYPPLLKPLSVPLDMWGHVVFGTERDVELLGRVVPSYVDYFWCVDHWWRGADDLRR